MAETFRGSRWCGSCPNLRIDRVARFARFSWAGMRLLCLVIVIAGFWLSVVDLIVLALSHSQASELHWPSAALSLAFAFVSGLVGTYYWRTSVLACLSTYALYAFIVAQSGYEFGSAIGWARGDPGYWWVFSQFRLVGLILLPFLGAGLIPLCFMKFGPHRKTFPMEVARIRRSLGAKRIDLVREIGSTEIFGVLIGILLASPALLGQTLDHMASWSGYVGELGVLTLPLVAVLLVLAIAVVISRDIKRRLRGRAERALERDLRRPVLLLRSFRDDAAVVRPNSLLARLQLRSVRLEEVIGDELSRFGPFIAIGAPSERIPQLGAYRAYPSEESWQDQVITWMEQSSVVVIVAGLTHWVQWELRAIRERSLLGKLVILIPPGDHETLVGRWQNLSACFAGHPAHCRLSRIEVSDVIGLFFTAGGEPVTIRSVNRRQLDYQLGLLTALTGLEQLGNIA